jgi:hypothetical protein
MRVKGLGQLRMCFVLGSTSPNNGDAGKIGMPVSLEGHGFVRDGMFHCEKFTYRIANSTVLYLRLHPYDKVERAFVEEVLREAMWHPTPDGKGVVGDQRFTAWCRQGRGYQLHLCFKATGRHWSPLPAETHDAEKILQLVRNILAKAVRRVHAQKKEK